MPPLPPCLSLLAPARFALASVLSFAALVAGCGSSDDEAPAPTPPAKLALKVLTYNIGNGDGAEPHYPLRLSYQAYEDHMAQVFSTLAPDVVFFQEVLPPQFCEAFEESDAARTCFDANNRLAPVQRLLGPEFSIVCDARLHVECIGVRKSVGAIRDVPAGAFVVDGAETPALPLPTCHYAAGECTDELCDQEATVSAVTVDTASGPLRLIHAHPNAAGTGNAGVYLGEPCRYEELRQLFEGASGGALLTPDRTIVAGDFNMDPDRLATPREKELWAKFVGEGKRLRDRNPKDPETGGYYPTRPTGLEITIDRVLSDTLEGACTVFGSSPEADGETTARLDQGFDWSKVPDGEKFAGRINHLAVFCELAEK